MKEINVRIQRLRDIMTYARRVSTDMVRRRRESDPALDEAIAAFLTQLHDLVALDGKVVIIDGNLTPLKKPCKMYDTCPLRSCDGHYEKPKMSTAKRRLTIPNE